MRNLLTIFFAFVSAFAFAATPTTGQFLFQRKQASGPFLQFGVTPTSGYAFGWDGTNVVMLDPTTGTVWGGIGGTLSNQTDLQTALNLKQATAGVLALGGFSSITGTMPAANLPATVAYTTNNLSAFAATTSAQLAGVISDETGTGALTFNNSPSLITPSVQANALSFSTILNTAATTANKTATFPDATGNVVLDSATQAITNKTYNGLTLTTSTGTITITNGKTLSLSNSLTFTGTDGSSVAFGTGGTVAYTANKLSAFAATTSAELAGVISDETGGAGVLMFNTSPTVNTSLVAGSATMALLNTTATTVNAFGAATNIVMGGATTSGTTTSSGLAMTFNALSSGTGVYIATNSSGPMLGGAKLLDIVMTGNGPSGGVFSAANVTLSGGNLFSGATTTGATISNTRTGISSTNNALTLTASGGSTNNALNITASGGATNNALNITAGNSLFPDGSASVPSIQFGSDTNTGIYRIGIDNIGIATAGTLRWHVSSAGSLFSGSGNYDYTVGASLFLGSSGSASAPTFSFGSSIDTNTGMYRYAEDKIGWATGGSARMSLEAGILRIGANMTGTCAAGSYILIEESGSAGICLSRTSATTGKYSFFTKGTGDFGFYDELNARYTINIEKGTGYIDVVNGLKVATGTAVVGILSATATLDFPSIAGAGGTQDLTVAVTGAVTGNVVSIGLPAAPNAGVMFNAYVSASNTVTIRATNATALAIDPASASYRVMVTKF